MLLQTVFALIEAVEENQAPKAMLLQTVFFCSDRGCR